ncbi:UDP-N-acetylglucosamine 4,6-dehydratase [Acidimicrobiaceae bacterium]|nr:UDP-N-acetylglucosamine 4,6-dehydratase [Acidimicrobiaceae bacterium]
MTRFLLTLDQAVDTVFEALQFAAAGETYIPKIKAALIQDVAAALIGSKKIKVVENGIRPGEKMHEIMISEEESLRTISRGDYFAIKSILPEVAAASTESPIDFAEVSSANYLMSTDEVKKFLKNICRVT